MRNLAAMWHEMVERSFHPSQWYEADDEDEEPTPSAQPSKELGPGVRAMWVYRLLDGQWAVGCWAPNRDWLADSAHATRAEAAARVHWLNGGS